MKIVPLKREYKWAPGGTGEWTGDTLSLTNDGTLEIFFVGCGSMFSKSMFQNNIIIIKGNTHIAVDLGNSFPTALWQVAGLKEGDIRCILPTHSHDDHAGGVGQIALFNKYIGRPFMKHPKLDCIITNYYQQILWDKTLSGSLEYNARYLLEDGEERMLNFSDFFHVIRPRWKEHKRREIFEVDYNGIKLEIFRTNHIPEQSEGWSDAFVSYGLYIDDKIFYTSDTKFDSELIAMYCDQAEYIFHDVQLFEPETVHAPLSVMKNIPSYVKEKTTLMHLSDDYVEKDLNGFAGWSQQGCRYIFD